MKTIIICHKLMDLLHFRSFTFLLLYIQLQIDFFFQMIPTIVAYEQEFQISW